jgi:hypothetical protein
MEVRKMTEQGSKECFCGHGGCRNVIDESEKYCNQCLDDIGEKYIGTQMATNNLDFLNRDY